MNALKVIIYFSIFKYPLTLEEIFSFSSAKSIDETRLQLQKLIKKKIVFKFGNFYSDINDSTLVERRLNGNKKANDIMPKALKRAKLIMSFPFIVSVSISGALSKNYYDEDGDIDFFIITKPKYLWLARTFLIIYKKIFLLNSKKYFCVSTDKAANPVNMMGASKRIMEMFVNRKSLDIKVSMARFANVAFSDGSLLHGFNQRIQKSQPIVAPNDIKRYFVTPQESGELCLMSCIFGENRDIFFPKLSETLHLITFAEIAEKYLRELGYEPFLCSSESEARSLSDSLPEKGQWPCYFTDSDTTGEKDFEEFFTENETVDVDRFQNLGVIKNDVEYNQKFIEEFEQSISNLKGLNVWSKLQILDIFQKILPSFGHKETGKYLDNKM